MHSGLLDGKFYPRGTQRRYEIRLALITSMYEDIMVSISSLDVKFYPLDTQRRYEIPLALLTSAYEDIMVSIGLFTSEHSSVLLLLHSLPEKKQTNK